MAPDTDFQRSRKLVRLPWEGGVSLAWRILAVNIIALALLAGGFFYIDSYRLRIIDERLAQSENRLDLLRVLALHTSTDKHKNMALDFAKQTDERIRIYAPDGSLMFDTALAGGPDYQLVDPEEEALKRHVARFLDRMVDGIVSADPLPAFKEPKVDIARNWPTIVSATAAGHAIARASYAPDRTPMISAAVKLDNGETILSVINARDITRTVRAERLRLGLVLASAIIASIALSLFLARTIVTPLQRLARAAARVRLGRARQVTVPRLPSRRDEIGAVLGAGLRTENCADFENGEIVEPARQVAVRHVEQTRQQRRAQETHTRVERIRELDLADRAAVR